MSRFPRIWRVNREGIDSRAVQRAFLTFNAGLALVARCVNRYSPLDREAKRLPHLHRIAYADLVRSYVGILCAGKYDFEVAERFPDDPWFREALGSGRVPSSVPLRRRFDARAPKLGKVVDVLSVPMLSGLAGR